MVREAHGSPIRSFLAVSIVLAFGLVLAAPGCGSGGGGLSVPRAVALLLDDLTAVLLSGSTDLPLTLAPSGISNPNATMPADIQNGVPIAASGAAHAGTVASVNYSFSETRNANGSGSFTMTVADAADAGRVFLTATGTYGAPSISYAAPPIGATSLLTAGGTGQSFVILRISRTISWTRTFANNPTGTGTGTLVNFSAAPAIAPLSDGTITGTFREAESFLVEFDVSAGPPTNAATIVDVDGLHDVETFSRSGSGISVSSFAHSHAITVDITGGPMNALRNSAAALIPVGADAQTTTFAADGNAVHFTSGRISGGLSSADPIENDVGGSWVDVTNDGVAPIIDGNFDGLTTYALDLTLDVISGSGTVGDGTVQSRIMSIDTLEQEDQTTADNFDHPLPGEFFDALYGMVYASTETGIIIWR